MRKQGGPPWAGKGSGRGEGEGMLPACFGAYPVALVKAKRVCTLKSVNLGQEGMLPA